MKPIEDIVTAIARQHLGIATLQTRNGDSLDFHDPSVWAIRGALKAAFDAGAEAAGTTVPKLLAALEGALYALDENREGSGPSKRQAIASARAAIAGAKTSYAIYQLANDEATYGADALKFIDTGADHEEEYSGPMAGKGARAFAAALIACAGLPTPELERGILRDLLDLAERIVLAKDDEQSVPVDIYHAAARLVSRYQS